MFHFGLLSLLLCVVLQVPPACGLEANRVRLVDYSNETGNFLFRCGDPTYSSGYESGYEYDALAKLFAVHAQSAGLSFPRKYYVIDVAFWTTDVEQLTRISKFFYRNPSLGKPVNWPVYELTPSMVRRGCEYNNITGCRALAYSDFQPWKRQIMAKTFLDWADMGPEGSLITQRVMTLRHWLRNVKQDVPLVIVGHCSCGCDRTGAVFGIYSMLFQNMPYADVVRRSHAIAGRPVAYGHHIYIQWYCSYLMHTSPSRYPALTDCADKIA